MVWEYAAGGKYFNSAQRLENGNTLVCEQGLTAYELTPDKKQIWKVEATKVYDARRLPNGNTIITTTTESLEVTPQNKVVWKRDTNGSRGRTRR